MILAILQARMSSKRLPGKVLMPILGEPMLARQIERIKKSNRIDKLIVATSTDPSDDAIEALCKLKSFICYRGSLNDVLDRFYQAAAPYKPQFILRFTGDCPLLDPGLIDDIIKFHIAGEYDYTSNAFDPTFPDGLDTEIFSFTLLHEAWYKATAASHREHVTQYFYQTPRVRKIGNYQYKTNLSHLRWTVDHPQDFKFVSCVYEALYPSNPAFTFQEILKYLESHPELLAVNSHFKRNEGLITQ